MVCLYAFIAGFSLLRLVLADVTDPCPFWPQALQVDGQCYKAFQEHYNYHDAQDFCQQQSQGAHLPEILTPQQSDLVNYILQSSYDTNSVYYAWLGANLMNATTSSFEWVRSGLILYKNSSLWAHSEPNNVGHNEKCAVLHADGFVDLECGSEAAHIAVICQKDPRPVTNPCYFWEGATYVNGKCFKFFNRSSTWSAALEFCKNQKPSATLAELFTDQERKVLSDMRQKIGSDGVWLGCSDSQTENTFLWTSSASSAPVKCDAWWSPGQPGNSQQQGHCVVLNTETTGRLENVDCGGNRSVVCQTTVHNPCEMIMSPQAEYFQGRCFLFRKDREGWDDAQDYCSRRAGYLAEPTTIGLQEYVLELASRNTGDAPVWVGGQAKDGDLRWRYTGDRVRMAVNPVIDDCRLQVQGQTRTWSCTGGNSQRYFICERDIGDPCETYLPGAVYSRGQCFRYFEEPQTWKNAKAFCDEKEAFLAEPSTSELSDVVNTYLQNLHAPTAWIGGTVLDDTNLQWAMSGHGLNYSLLKDSQSSNYTEGYLAVQNGSFWSIEGKLAVHPFVCQRAVQLGSATQRSVVAMFPKLQNVDQLDGYVQITGTALSYRVSLEISKSMNARDPNSTVAFLEPRDVLYYKFDPGQLVDTEGLHYSYIRVSSSSPVTAVLYIVSSSQLAASTLLLPSDLLQTYDAGFSCFLVSVCKSNCAENIVAAATLDGPSDVNMLFHKSPSVNRSLSAGDIAYRQITTVTASATSKRGSVYFNNNIDFNGSYLTSTNKLAVLIGGAGASTEDNQDFALDQVLPIQFIASDYITFPSVDHKLRDFVKVVAVESDTTIQIYESELGNSNRRLHLDKAGDVGEIQLLNGIFFHMNGTSPFYAFKFSRNEAGSPVCLTSLYPNGLWKHQYHFQVPPELAAYTIVIAVIVSRQYTSDITFGDSSISKSCNDIQGTQLAGCKYNLAFNSRAFYHLHLRNFRERLGAYMIASSATSVVCHPLGTRDSPLPSYVFNSEEYHRTFSDTPECDHSTIATVIDTTTESSETNSTSDQSPETDRVTTTDATLSLSSSTSTEKHAGFNSESASLFVGCKQTSAYRRSKISVPDNRVSSVTIGSAGIICLVVTFSIVLIGDLIRFCKFLDDTLQKGKIQYYSYAN